MSHKMQGAVCLVGLLILFAHNGCGLLCDFCSSRAQCQAGGSSVLCNSTTVNETHSAVASVNPSLSTPPTGDPVYNCLRLDMMYRSALTGSMVSVYQHGCTYNHTNFATGWSVEVDLNVTAKCDTDYCNRIAEGTTAVPGNSSTTSTVATTTGAAASTSTTIAGASSSSVSTGAVTQSTGAVATSTSSAGTTVTGAPQTTSTSVPIETTTKAGAACLLNSTRLAAVVLVVIWALKIYGP